MVLSFFRKHNSEQCFVGCFPEIYAIPEFHAVQKFQLLVSYAEIMGKFEVENPGFWCVAIQFLLQVFATVYSANADAVLFV